MTSRECTKEANRLSTLKARLAGMAPDSPWYPVLQRYVAHVSARVRALGGDPDGITVGGIEPAPDGAGAEPCPELVEYTGQVTELIRDQSGRVHTVRLSGPGGCVLLQATEEAIGSLAAVAHREQLPLAVFAEPGPQPRIRNLVIRG